VRSFPPNLNTDFFTERSGGGDDTLDLVQLRAAANLRPSPELPGRLARHAPATLVRPPRLDGSS
jgi:blue copper oxidase